MQEIITEERLRYAAKIYHTIPDAARALGVSRAGVQRAARKYNVQFRFRTSQIEDHGRNGYENPERWFT